MSALLLAIALAAAPARPVTVVGRATLGLNATQAAALHKQLAAALRGEGLEAEAVAESCGDRTCLVAKSLKLDRCVVGVTLLKSKKGLSVDVEAVDGELLVLQQTFLVTIERLDKSPEAQVFAHQLANKRVPDAPVAEPKPPPEEPKPTLREPVVETRPTWVEPGPAERSAGPLVLGVSGAVVGAVGLGLVIAGAVVKGQLDAALAQAPVVTSLTRAEAQSQASLANGLLVGGLVGLSLGGVATSVGFGYALAPPPPPEVR